jgi:hypothetical protein
MSDGFVNQPLYSALKNCETSAWYSLMIQTAGTRLSKNYTTVAPAKMVANCHFQQK